MKQTGEILRNAREEAKLSISEVALSTKINPKILASIEAGDSTNLPARTFLKGFIRSYALFLKIDPEEVMKVYNAETGVVVPPATEEAPQAAVEAPAPAPAPTPKRRVDEEEGFRGLRIIAVSVIVVLIGLIIGVRELIEKYQREKVVDAVAEIKVNPLPKASEEVKPDEKKVEETKPAQIMVAETKPEETKPEETTPVETKAVEEKVAIAEAPAPEAPPPQPTSILKSVRNEIILEALDKVDVKFKIQGETKTVSLGPMQVHTIFAQGPMTLDLSDGGAVNIILNGRERGVPGDLGKPKQVKIP